MKAKLPYLVRFFEEKYGLAALIVSLLLTRGENLLKLKDFQLHNWYKKQKKFSIH